LASLIIKSHLGKAEFQEAKFPLWGKKNCARTQNIDIYQERKLFQKEVP
jgi:hypothetical protein